MGTFGNTDILKFSKIGFLCSQKCPAEIVLRSYDWAIAQKKIGNCIVCGNHSQIEKDVFGILLKGSQPLVLVLARGMKLRWDAKIEEEVNKGRLLVISPFKKEVKRVTREIARQRNQKIIEMCDELTIGHISMGGQLEELLKDKKYFLL